MIYLILFVITILFIVWTYYEGGKVPTHDSDNTLYKPAGTIYLGSAAGSQAKEPPI